jgi:uncharacterized membrane protein
MSLTELVLIVLFSWIVHLTFRLRGLERVIKKLQEQIANLSIAQEEQTAIDKPLAQKEVAFSKRASIEQESRQDYTKEPTHDKPTYNKEEKKVFVKSDTTTENAVDKSLKAKPKENYKKDNTHSDSSKEPSWFVRTFVNYFTGGNLLVRIGGVVLFFGLAFLVKYAAEHSTISIGTRLMLVALVAASLVVVGWFLRNKEGAYGQILQGLGIAIFYLVIYGASKYYTILSLKIAFAFMLMASVVGSILAVIQNSLWLALFSIVGGFLVPILVSDGEGSHIVLFGYYLFLNIGIAIVAWYRSWRVLNIAGFIFTFVIATIWGILRYRPELFATTEPFLIAFFLIYLIISILFVRQSYGNLVDSVLTFALPAAAFGLQVGLVKSIEYGAAYSATILSILYAFLAWILMRKELYSRLSMSFAILSVVFFTVAIPYYFDADVTAALWALESAAAIWLALKQSREYSRYGAELLQIVSLVLYLIASVGHGADIAEYIGYIIVAGSLFATSYNLQKHQDKLRYDLYHPYILMALSIVVWLISGFEVAQEVKAFALYHKMFIAISLGGALLVVLGNWLKWELPSRFAEGIPGIGIFFFAIIIAIKGVPLHPLGGIGWLAISLWLSLSYFLIYNYQHKWKTVHIYHVLLLWLVLFLLVLETLYWTTKWHWSYIWVEVALAFFPLIVLYLLSMHNRYIEWLRPYKMQYCKIAAMGVALYLTIWQIWTFAMAEKSNVTWYLPILNPLDSAQILVAATIAWWLYRCKNLIKIDSLKNPLASIAYFFGVVLATVILARAIHFYRGVDYNISSIWQDLYFQTGLSVLWSTIAIVLMLLSKRFKSRALWKFGFGLLVAVTLKLFFVELANSGTIERIVSFIVVGVLLLVIGYFVPLPPKTNLEEKSKNETNSNANDFKESKDLE